MGLKHHSLRQRNKPHATAAAPSGAGSQRASSSTSRRSRASSVPSYLNTCFKSVVHFFQPSSSSMPKHTAGAQLLGLLPCPSYLWQRGPPARRCPRAGGEPRWRPAHSARRGTTPAPRRSQPCRAQCSTAVGPQFQPCAQGVNMRLNMHLRTRTMPPSTFATGREPWLAPHTASKG